MHVCVYTQALTNVLITLFAATLIAVDALAIGKVMPVSATALPFLLFKWQKRTLVIGYFQIWN